MTVCECASCFVNSDKFVAALSEPIAREVIVKRLAADRRAALERSAVPLWQLKPAAPPAFEDFQRTVLDDVITRERAKFRGKFEEAEMAELTERDSEFLAEFRQATNPKTLKDADRAERFYSEHPGLYDAHRRAVDNPEVASAVGHMSRILVERRIEGEIKRLMDADSTLGYGDAAEAVSKLFPEWF